MGDNRCVWKSTTTSFMAPLPLLLLLLLLLCSVGAAGIISMRCGALMNDCLDGSPAVRRRYTARRPVKYL